MAKRRFGFHAQKLLQESALDRNFLKSPEQSVELETGRIGRANASHISLITDEQPVAGKGNGRVAVKVLGGRRIWVESEMGKGSAFSFALPEISSPPS